MPVAAFDPGLSGAVAIYAPEGRVGYTLGDSRDIMGVTFSVHDLPVIGDGTKRFIDGGALTRLLREEAVDYAIIEQVGSMPGQGVSSTFKFGTVYGQLIGIVQSMEIAYEFVSPTKWKRNMKIPGAKDGGKEIARQMAIQTFPKLGDRLQRKKDHNRAEALMLIKWYLKHSVIRRVRL